MPLVLAPPPPSGVAQWGMEEKFRTVVSMATATVSNDAAQELKGLFTPAYLAVLAGKVGLFLVLQFLPGADAAEDVVVATDLVRTAVMLTLEGVDLATYCGHVEQFVQLTMQAQSHVDLSRAASALADAMTIGGTEALKSLLDAIP